MDPKTNLAEQLKLVRDLQAFDEIEEPDEDQELQAVQDGVRLAELVIALDEWMRKGGFSPW